jgi:hypothetical protein
MRIILRRQPLLLDIVGSLGESPLTEESREEIREVLVEELCESGLREDDEPNEYGRKVDDLIGLLMYY